MEGRILGIAPRIFTPGLSDTARGIEQAIAIWIVAGPADQRPHRFAHFARNFILGRGFHEVAILRITMFDRRGHRPSSRAISTAIAAACSRMSGTAMISQYRPFVSGPR